MLLISSMVRCVPLQMNKPCEQRNTSNVCSSLLEVASCTGNQINRYLPWVCVHAHSPLHVVEADAMLSCFVALGKSDGYLEGHFDIVKAIAKDAMPPIWWSGRNDRVLCYRLCVIGCSNIDWPNGSGGLTMQACRHGIYVFTHRARSLITHADPSPITHGDPSLCTHGVPSLLPTLVYLSHVIYSHCRAVADACWFYPLS